MFGNALTENRRSARSPSPESERILHFSQQVSHEYELERAHYENKTLRKSTTRLLRPVSVHAMDNRAGEVAIEHRTNVSEVEYKSDEQ